MRENNRIVVASAVVLVVEYLEGCFFFWTCLSSEVVKLTNFNITSPKNCRTWKLIIYLIYV